MFTVALGSMLYGLVVEAMMLNELAILAGYNGYRQGGRNLTERHPVVGEFQILAFLQLLIAADDHQRCHPYWQETVHHNRKNSGSKECHHYPFQNFLNKLERIHFFTFLLFYLFTFY